MAIAVPLVIALCGTAAWRKRHDQDQKDSILNYRIGYAKPADWKELHHGPQTLFLYQDPVTHVLVRGAVNQVVAEVNPTPQLNSAKMAEFYVDRTSENMPDWKAAKLGTVEANGATFNLIQRTRKGKEVVTAFAVRGNTTLLVSISGNGREVEQVNTMLPRFEKFLSTMSLTRQDMSNL